MLYDYNYFKNAASQWGVVFKHDNEWMKKHCYPVAVYTRFIVNGKVVPYIIVSNNFFKLSIETQRFVYAHELGHHFQYEYNTRNSMNSIEAECDADDYAKARVGGSKYAIKALKELQWAAEKLNCNSAINELQLRIDYIINKKIKTI